ncbi:dihydroneopterin aldolase [Lentilactobacillus curieae]|uniref:7,8-dihydroneopterin aldolase n=1 Tax=Lentilactobacillus curieae TaxID=1138822 RepID=A0A1S6QKE1_9LACO|nr:dihydroneopterin aldolase [Lentilactobacillus curieae]AQW22050.1 dihydroneopterin aldolase [Lentilactobacillus curieae]
MYKITVNNMQFHSHIGVLPEERVVGQPLQIDLIAEINAKPENDDLNSTVSYADFYPTIKRIIDKSNDKLLETLADKIISKIKQIDNRITRLTVRIRKINLPVDGVFDNVEIEVTE